MKVDNIQVKNGGRNAEPTSTFKIRVKDTSVNIKDIDQNLIGYINTLPEDIQKEVLVTSGNDSDAHSKKSWHYHNKAVDLRYSHKLYNYMATDPNRIKYRISLYNPNHGTGKHLHLSHIGEEGVKNGAKEHTKDVFLNVYSPEAQEYLRDPKNDKFEELKKIAMSYGSQAYKGSVGVDSVAGSYGVWEDVSYKNDFETGSYGENIYNDSSHFTQYNDLSHNNLSYNSLVDDTVNSEEESDEVSQNKLLLSKLLELENDRRKEMEYNSAQALENKNKIKLAQKQQEYEFIKSLINNTPSLVSESKNRGQENFFDPNMFQITNFKNDFVVE